MVKISELQAQLEEIKQKDGDVEVCISHYDEGYPISIILSGPMAVEDENGDIEETEKQYCWICYD